MTITARFDDTTVPAVPTLVIAGTGRRPAHVRLVGRRAIVDARLTGRGTTWTARLPLEAARWGRAPLPLPSGVYAVEVVDGDGARVPVDAAIADTMTTTMRVALADGALRVRPPIDPAYESGEGQTRSSAATRHVRKPRERGVLRELLRPQCELQPRAIDRELARVAPGVTRYWSVVDLSVEVPEGRSGRGGSPQWWRARGSARLLVVNDWLRRRYARGPAKSFCRPGTARRSSDSRCTAGDSTPPHGCGHPRGSTLGCPARAEPLRERVLRKAYAFLGRPVGRGYPRNDALVAGVPDAARGARDRLGRARHPVCADVARRS
jgi:CDP-glycerol glycerophosphotransferase